MGMVSSFSIVNQLGYLEIAIQGNYDFWEFIDYPQLIRKSCDENHCNKILIDVTPVKAEEVSLIELFFIGEQIAKVLASDVLVALIWKRESLSDFLLDVATNRAAKFKVFDNRKSAEYWLTQKY